MRLLILGSYQRLAAEIGRIERKTREPLFYPWQVHAPVQVPAALNKGSDADKPAALIERDGQHPACVHPARLQGDPRGMLVYARARLLSAEKLPVLVEGR